MADRFPRQRALEGIGSTGQAALRNARVLVVGVGALGAPIVQYLAGAGVGALRLVDGDVVALHNLHRQVLFGVADVGRSKAVVAAERVADLDPSIEVDPVAQRLDPATVDDLVAECDVVLDATDDWATSHLLDAACARVGVPLVWGSVLAWHGQLTVLGDRATPGGNERVRLAHLYPEDAPLDPASCATAGVLGPLCGVIGAAMAAEAMKLLTGAGTPLIGRVALHDAAAATWDEVAFDPPAATRSAAPGDAGASGDEGAGPGAGPGAETTDSTVGSVDEAGVTRMRSVVSALTSSMGSSLGASLGGPFAAARPTAAIDGPRPVTPAAAARLVDAGDAVLVDVREAWERDLAAVPASVWAPLATVLDGSAVLPPGALLVHCHHDTRSRAAADVLAAGGREVRWVVGGIDAWARDLDPTIARY